MSEYIYKWVTETFMSKGKMITRTRRVKVKVIAETNVTSERATNGASE